LSKLGWPTWHKTGFRQRKLNQRPLGFRMLNWQLLGFRIHMRKLNQQPFRFKKLNRQQLGFRAGKYLVTCNQRDMRQRARPEWHPPELSSHVKFSKLNRSLRLRFRTSELKTMIESDSVTVCRTAIQHHRSAGSSSSWSLPVQSKRSSASNEQDVKPLLNTASLTGAQHQSQQVQRSSSSYTSLGDKQEDASGNKIIAGHDDNNSKHERRDRVSK